ncbi:hypothetical protein BNJ_00015 [Kaumoebavirus]|uniref:hypothetical protein n=1 Tax=Kaumoebavirus TaxID=1859492 RepID=UPI0009C2348B|nr:hypothetical protein BNJ_00015 [Kaumoebavirus]ARA71860.1 hypothetical protein BNJ_00015 [Kaumoebavirus]
MLRKVVDPELVEVLDEILPREITDEILAYYLWHPELGQVRGITTYYPVGERYSRNGCVFRIAGRTQYFAEIRDGELYQSNLGRITSVTWGIRLTDPVPMSRENMVRFWNGGEY